MAVHPNSLANLAKGRRFVKGQSGNPSGRAAAQARAWDQLDQLLLEVVKDKKTKENVELGLAALRSMLGEAIRPAEEAEAMGILQLKIAMMNKVIDRLLPMLQKQEISGADGGPIDILHGRMLQDLSDDDLDRLGRELASRRAAAADRIRRAGGNGSCSSGGNASPK